MMNQPYLRLHVIRFIIAAAICLLFSVAGFAKTAGCPCGACPCHPCVCGGGSNDHNSGSKNDGKGAPKGGDKSKPGGGDKHAGKSHDGGGGHHHGHDGGGHGSVGIGVSVDLSGIGQRKAEPDPFAVAGPPTGQTHEKTEKPKAKHKDSEVITAKNDPFANIELTGEQAKTDGKVGNNR